MWRKRCIDGETSAAKRFNLRSASTKLSDLNDDCLNEIFHYFDAIDLSFVAHVCYRWKQLAESHFYMRYRKINFNTLNQQRISYQIVRNILIDFGQMIKSTELTLNSGLVDDEIIDAIVKLKELEILSFDRMIGLSNEHLIKCAKELTQLKQLSFQENISADVLQELVRSAKQLIYLRIRSNNLIFDRSHYKNILDILKERRNRINLNITINHH